ncbi:response regulator receiver domain-containing protein [Leptospira meyeri]|uniref:Response regulator receiver domain-containing protein n=1 Tax=Leptospira meyeri TaxID=29508 RepID=A0A4R8N1P4_LEPME|nr:response regulator [Leptospira meyeri]EKJ86442.1 response regulator receiver domain protein [Leptospira meyeri serovar Hardjo str. Went 5]TDY73166.1 response regulator receiver domain-containing protein [Leptospira meyeri]TGL51237.1 DNA-binding response regulator [Leptospira meyeri]
MKKVLIVDDNDRYANNLKSYFDSKNIPSDRAIDAKEGFALFSKNPNYDMIVSDVTMETQTSGLWMMRQIYKSGYKGILVIASTGFDVFGVMSFSSLFLPWFCGLHWMIPKVPLKKGTVEWVPTVLSKGKSNPF